MQLVFRHLRWQLNTIAQQTETRQAYGKISLFLVCFDTLANNLQGFARPKTVLLLILIQRCVCKTALEFKE